MSARRLRGLGAAAALALALTACGGGDDAATEVVTDAKFPAGSSMAKFNEAGTIKIGTKFDQPGIGAKKPGADAPEGFDPEMAKIVAAKLGIEPDKIKWVETVSDNREPFLQNGTVDLVFASYSITDERRQVVGQAGPYYVTGQQLLVAKDDDSIKGPDDLEGKKVCSVEGSTSIKTVEEEYGANPAPFATYSECVQQLLSGSVDAVTTDGAILLGYTAENPDKLKVVGDAFSEERYGIGFKKDDTKLCNFLNETLEASFEDGSWQEAFDQTLGEAGVEAPEAPTVDPCE
ncbi:MAG: glutamate ABC transporter substrate-binding protein [Sporichthyaceae bacterium]|nr:glutamate ABC transporter substrate-binding protein [Sporichthyaceae bacterium]